MHRLVEPYLTTCREAKYREMFPGLKRAIEQTQSEAQQLGFQVAGISNEMLSFSPPDHIDVHTKALRIRELFGSDCRIIIMIREQFSLLKSLYKEFVRQGISHTYQEFLRYQFMYQDRSFLHDLLYDKTYARYAELFGRENILILPIEDYLTHDGHLTIDGEGRSLVEKLNLFLGVKNIPLTLDHQNPSLSDVETERKRLLNLQYPHDFGRGLFSAPLIHRLQPYLEQDIGISLGDTAYEDVRIKRKSLEESLKSDATPMPDFNMPEDLKKPLETIFQDSNRSLKQMTGIRMDGYVI